MAEKKTPASDDAGPIESVCVVGIVAGQGDEPRDVIAACLAQGRPFFLLAFEGQTEPGVVDGLPHEWVRLGAGGKALKILKREQVSQVVLAGAFERPSLKDLRPDMWTAAFIARNGTKIFDDTDGLVAAVMHELEKKEGIRIVPVSEILENR